MARLLRRGHPRPDDVIDHMFVCSGGSLATLAKAARVAVTDYRDLWMWADQVGRETTPAKGSPDGGPRFT